MASEESNDGTVSFALPAEVDDWLDEQAERRDEDRETVCQRVLVAAHTASTDDSFDPVDRDDLATLDARIDDQREEFTDLLEDVRERVIQVKRESDASAPADHDHPDHADESDLDDLRSTVATLESDLAALDETTRSGFDNFEEILEHLVEETEDLGERSTILAKAVVDIRDRRDALVARERRRAETDELKLAANRFGVRTANCEECATGVDLGLLTHPECPHCGSSFADVVQKSSIFGSPRLVTGDPPALEGRVRDAIASDDADDVFEAVAADAEANAEPDPVDTGATAERDSDEAEVPR